MAKKRPFNPFGKGYDIKTAKKAGMKRKASGKNKGHLGSLEPKSGMVLKGMRHKSATQMKAVEELLDNQIKYNPNKGRYYSSPKKRRTK